MCSYAIDFDSFYQVTTGDLLFFSEKYHEIPSELSTRILLLTLQMLNSNIILSSLYRNDRNTLV